MAEKSPGSAPQAERFHPDPAAGLTEAQAEERRRLGLVNGKGKTRTKTVGQIICGNVFTFFNLLNFALAGLILSVHSYKNLLFLGVIFSNIAIGIFQELRAKKTIDSLTLVTAPKARVIRGGLEKEIAVSEIALDDVLVLSAGSQVPADCVILNGTCEADESLLTGESDPIDKRCSDLLLSGSFLVSGKCRARADHVGSDNYAEKIASGAKYVKGSTSQITRWINRIIRMIAFVIVPVGAALFCRQYFRLKMSYHHSVVSTVAAMIGMIPEGLVLLTSVVFAVGVMRLARRRALVQELSSIETLARVDTLCLDKTGTLTEGAMQLDGVMPLGGFSEKSAEVILAALAGAQEDSTPTMNAVRAAFPNPPQWSCGKRWAFSSARKWSGASFGSDGSYALGAAEFILRERFGELRGETERYAEQGKRVLLLAKLDGFSADGFLPEQAVPAALVILSDKIRPNAKDALAFFSEQGVSLKVISGDSPATVSSIARRAGLKNAELCADASLLKSEEELQEAAEKYTVFGRVTPAQKLSLVKALKQKGHTVAMTGDGVNDVPALRESDCSIAMASGSDAARIVSNIVLLDSDFASMPRIVAEGRRCINNLQRSAILFLVKAFFAILSAAAVAALGSAYPFQPIHFTLMNAVSIGIPSFFLALEPNRERISGSFSENVLRKTLPGALTLTANIILLAAVSALVPFSAREASTLAVLLTGCTELTVLFQVCRPFTLPHGILFGAMTGSFLAALIAFPRLFEVMPLSRAMVLALIPLLFAAAAMEAAFTRLSEKIRFRGPLR